MRPVLAELCQIVGLVLLAVGAFELAVWLGFVVAGLSVFAFGLSLDPAGRARPSRLRARSRGSEQP